MKAQRLMTIVAAGLLVLSGSVLVGCQQATKNVDTSNYAGTATVYWVGHQGGYIGEATVTTDKSGNVTDASLHEWVGPTDWSTTTGGEIVRVPDPLANATSTDPEIKGYQFYQYSATTKNWLQYNLNKTGTAFAASTKIERDFEGTMGNPIRAEAYAKAAAAGTLVAVTIAGATVTKGQAATATVTVGNLDKVNAASTYMPMTNAASGASIGYRENTKATLAFFTTNPGASYSSAKLQNLDMAAKTTDYPAAVSANYAAQKDDIWTVADVVTGATYSDFPLYATQLQNAYILALADVKSGNLRAAK